MKFTLCTYESPAAQHDIDEWRRKADLNGHIIEWRDHPDGSCRVLLQGHELMVIWPLTPLPHGYVDVNPLMASVREHTWNKWIHFGKQLLTPYQYAMVAQHVPMLHPPRQRKQPESEGI